MSWPKKPKKAPKKKGPKKPKKAKEPFWKKVGPELKSITEHMGKISDNTDMKNLFDVALMGALAVVGYEKTRDWRGALIGPIGLKLATTMGGTPAVSQIAGLSILGVLGLLVIGAHPEMKVFGKTISEMEAEGTLPEWWPHIAVGG